MSQLTRFAQAAATSNIVKISRSSFTCMYRMFSGDELGRGAGKGGGGGGSIREAGGTFGKMEAAREEEYFKRLQSKQLRELKHVIDHEVEHLELENTRHEEAIRRNRQRIVELQDKMNPSSSDEEK